MRHGWQSSVLRATILKPLTAIVQQEPAMCLNIQENPVCGGTWVFSVQKAKQKAK